MTNRTVGIRLIVLLCFALIFGGICHALTVYQITCKNPECGFRGSAGIGDLEDFHVVTGFCCKCDRFVSLKWRWRAGDKKLDKEEPPTPLGQIVDTATGKRLTLYACPECRGPFLPVRDIQHVKHCPKCGKEEMAKEATLHGD